MAKWHRGKYNANYKYKSKNAIGDAALDSLMYPIFIVALIILLAPFLIPIIIIYLIIDAARSK